MTDRHTRMMNKLTINQIETLLLISKGRRVFHARDAKPVERLVYANLITANFDISERDALRGRVHEIWRKCTLTAEGETLCIAIKARFAELVK